MKLLFACLATVLMVSGCNTPNGSGRTESSTPQANPAVVRGGTGADGSAGAGKPMNAGGAGTVGGASANGTR